MSVEGKIDLPVRARARGPRETLAVLRARLRRSEMLLKLSQRVATIESLDDLLITFDDERARAILPQLAGLAKRTQVFLFTHHEHLVELCRQTLGEDQFKLHRLEAGVPSPHDEAV